MNGDVIKVISGTGTVYGGVVHVVEDLDVGLRFHGSFRNSPGQLFHIQFSLHRVPLRRMHQALSLPDHSSRLLFPTVEQVLRSAAPSMDQFRSFPLYNRAIAGNLPQAQAVASIITQPTGSAPFIVFGPPGTGKTVTIVEAMLQVLHRNPNARLLACAPSNSAADIIAERLIDSGELTDRQLFRLVASSRRRQHISPKLVNFTMTNHRGAFTVPAAKDFRHFRVVVATCVAAYTLYSMGVSRGHFSHIFIDEAGHALEPEVMIPVKTMADHRTNVVLSGDPMQLGPVIHSHVGRTLGLGVSYLDRLMATDMYHPRIGHGLTTVKLTKNFRSHPSILDFPNKQFYDGELTPCGNTQLINSLAQWSGLVTPGFPILFHGISGQDMREGHSPSYFNPDEASLVKDYVCKLRTDSRLGLDDSHIGVIAPYSAQCGKIRTILRQQYSGITVGSAEQFQGQERRAIIISTVRSSREEIEFDLRHTLGFVANQRRFNVATTRAQALLIVVGDPTVLALDSMWRKFMKYVLDSGGWRGVMPDDFGPGEGLRSAHDPDHRRVEDHIRQMIEQASGGGDIADDVERVELAADAPWRVME
ncbi:hypothetical protein BOTBODRAFT_244447 [Botryobasidium botryosum FD-172 SS1]|uniref:RNA helicase n=1 Tax=Botryobasidium botryosum (strain FD-172 SS1) TaxID=930990 RepID=A0A067LTT5_BOTB1|nr:hypothetical protein BOTBODRAFT_244447 [Botryobasidium botryosum FD-172 SS1]